jgi:hypothetical protein
MQIAPTVNIVVSYDPEAMMAFKDLGTFTAFREFQQKRDTELKAKLGEKYVPPTYIFNNSPNSTFLSLQHQFGKTDTKLEVEIIDPQGLFEKAMLDNTLQGQLSTKDNPIGERLETLQEEHLFGESKKRKLKRDRYAARQKGSPGLEELRRIDESLAGLQDTLDALDNQIEELDDLSTFDIDAKNASILQSQLDAQVSQMQRPVYVTYGVGNNFKDWAPIQCFGKIIKLEYSFTGTGVRILKIIFNGKSMHPNLLRGFGVNPMGADYVKGLLAKGSSYQIFNDEAAQQEAHAFIKENKDFILIPGGSGAVQYDMGEDIYKYLGQAMEPSFHRTVTTALTDFIQRASNYENVLVLIPNLDKWLKPYLDECLEGTWWTRPGIWAWATDSEEQQKTAVLMRGWQEALEGIGLKLVDVPNDDAYNAAIGENSYEYIEECSCQEDVESWFENRKFKVMVECDFEEQTFLQKLKEVGKAIETKIKDYNEEPISVNFMNQISVETDFEMLKILREHTVIPFATKPMVYWGDSKLRDAVLYARLLETNKIAIHQEKLDALDEGSDEYESMEQEGPTAVTSNDLISFVEGKLQQLLHPLDILDGLNVSYMNDVLDYAIPATSWIGAFGPMYQGDDGNSMALPDDANLSNSLKEIQGSNSKLGSRLPVFSFGTKNPNITDISIDINGIYTAAMNSAGPVGMPGQGTVAGIIPKGFEGQSLQMFRRMEGLDFNDVDDNGVPNGFKKLMEQFYESDFWTGDEAENFEEWGKVFNNMGDSAYANIEDKTFHGSNAKEDFMLFMWQAFQALYSKTHPTPLMQRKNASRSPGKKVIAKSAAVASKINDSALKGSITTLPMFSLSTDRRVLNRACILFCIEPQFIKSPKESGELPSSSTWYSGLYNMHGFTHTITTNSASSKFELSRPGNRGLGSKGSIVKDTE